MRRHFLVVFVAVMVFLGTTGTVISAADDSDGPLGEWHDFTPVGYITAPHPNNPVVQTHLYGDWGWIVGEEFIFNFNDFFTKLKKKRIHRLFIKPCLILINLSLN
ncbi:hypothetical protein ACFL4G_07130 [Thermodesulfobacteriota bacterium]